MSAIMTHSVAPTSPVHGRQAKAARWLQLAIGALCAALISACQSGPQLGEIDLNGNWQAAFAASPAPPTSLNAGNRDFREGGQMLETGDRLIYEFQIQTGDSFTRRYASIEDIGPSVETESGATAPVQANLTTPTRRVRLELFNDAGTSIRRATTTIDQAVGFGQLLACDFFAAQPAAAPSTDSHAQEVIQSLRSLTEFTNLIRRNNIIAHMFEDATRIPSLLSIALSMGVSIGLDPQYRTSKALDGGRRLMGMQMSINKAAALNFEFLIDAPIPPLTLSGGVLGFEARHPTNANFVRALLIGMGSSTQARSEN